MPPKTKRSPLDATRFVRSPNLDVRGTVALAVKLLGLVPASTQAKDAELIARVRGVARDLRESTVALQSAWGIREAQQDPKIRPFDLAFDNAWSAVLARLEPWATLSDEPDSAADAQRAAVLIGILFPLRLDFTRLEVHHQWAEGQKRIQRIEDEGLRPDLVRLVGDPFAQRLERAHAALGRALGLDGRPADGAATPTVDLLAGMRDVQQAIGAYALELVSVHRVASEELAEKIPGALSPIEEFRALAGRGPAPAAEPNTPVVGPETPVPPVPEA